VEQEADLGKLLLHSTSEFGLDLTAEQVAQFMGYLSQLVHWNKTINLTSITAPREIVVKHFVDSLIPLAVVPFPRQARLIDVGTGAGFPGIPLKIVRSDLQVMLIEPNKKKCAFLTSLIGTLRLANVEVFAGTAREYSERGHAPADMLLVRALHLDDIYSALRSLVVPTGKILLYRAEPLALAGSSSPLVIEEQRGFALPENAGDRVITVLSTKN
jgi:16S rRNA (guanine527-N7)-methyltransferase